MEIDEQEVTTMCQGLTETPPKGGKSEWNSSPWIARYRGKRGQVPSEIREPFGKSSGHLLDDIYFGREPSPSQD